MSNVEQKRQIDWAKTAKDSAPLVLGTGVLASAVVDAASFIQTSEHASLKDLALIALIGSAWGATIYLGTHEAQLKETIENGNGKRS